MPTSRIFTVPESSPIAARVRWRRIARHWLAAIILGVVVAVIVYWVRFAPGPVTAHAIEQGTVIAQAMGTGTLEARIQATISDMIFGAFF